MTDDKKQPIIGLGEVKGVQVTMTVSRKNRMQLIKDEFGDGDHIALSTWPVHTWADRPDISGEDLVAQFAHVRRTDPKYLEFALWTLYPKYHGIHLYDFGFQTCSNDAISAAREDIHAHVTFARQATWYSDAVPRFTTPVIPVPKKDRKPRE